MLGRFNVVARKYVFFVCFFGVFLVSQQARGKKKQCTIYLVNCRFHGLVCLRVSVVIVEGGLRLPASDGITVEPSLSSLRESVTSKKIFLVYLSIL